MKASLRSVRISPKKANMIAKMVRGMPVQDALYSLERTQKRSARILEGLLKSAIANAQQNEKQNPENLVIKSLIVNKAQTYHRGVPMARGRVRPMRKFLSHISVTLGIATDETSQKKEEKASSQKPQKAVKKQQKSAPATKAKTDDQDRGNGSSKESKKNTSPDPSVSAESTSSTPS